MVSIRGLWGHLLYIVTFLVFFLFRNSHTVCKQFGPDQMVQATATDLVLLCLCIHSDHLDKLRNFYKHLLVLSTAVASLLL